MHGTTRRVINTIGAGLMLADAVCMGILSIAASRWEGTPRADRVDTAVVIIQLIVLLGM